jgi:hypothetical protein
MKQTVHTDNGQTLPKYVVANRALVSVARRIEAYSTNTASSPRTIQAGLFVFKDEGSRQAIKFGPFHPADFEKWAREFKSPDGGTPLGRALENASRAVMASGLAHKHVLIITDGTNTVGSPPDSVLPGLLRQAKAKETVLSVHFIAFDVDAKVFEGVKKQGATVVGAGNETQLNQQLQFILEKKILLEDEEPQKPK